MDNLSENSSDETLSQIEVSKIYSSNSISLNFDSIVLNTRQATLTLTLSASLIFLPFFFALTYEFNYCDISTKDNNQRGKRGKVQLLNEANVNVFFDKVIVLQLIYVIFTFLHYYFPFLSQIKHINPERLWTVQKPLINISVRLKDMPPWVRTRLFKMKSPILDDTREFYFN